MHLSQSCCLLVVLTVLFIRSIIKRKACLPKPVLGVQVCSESCWILRHISLNLQFAACRYYSHSYCTFCQVSTLVPLKDWCDENKKPGQKFRNQAERKKFVKDRGLKVVKHPKSGADCVPILDKTVMLSGSRLSTTRVRESEHDSRADAKEMFHKQKRSIDDIQTNTKAGSAVSRS